MITANQSLSRLLKTIRQLRSSEGCPWDRKQTAPSLRKYLHEEFDEIITAIDNNDADNLCEELGDFLYLILMLSEINREQGLFTINDVIKSIDDKLVRRHPHVFEGQTDLDENELREQWQRIKAEEKENK